MCGKEQESKAHPIALLVILMPPKDFLTKTRFGYLPNEYF
jgi:hypothetical protein